MLKNDVISKLSEKTGLKKSDNEKFLAAFQEVVVETVASGESVALMGFGSWECKERIGRMGCNPKTGEPVQIEPKRVVKFKVGKVFRDAVGALPIK